MALPQRAHLVLKFRLAAEASLTSIDRRAFIGGSLAVMGAAGLRLPLWAQAAAAGPLLFGVDYYPDQTPEALWGDDARMIAEAGLTNVRIAEFAWGLMEPSEGKFEFGWLEKSCDILDKNKIAIILGTPSAAPPPWLSKKYPEIMEVDEKGQKLHTGGRRFTCPSNKTYRRLSVAIATEMAKNFADTPGVIGWQIDNEMTLGSSRRCYCDYCQLGFQDWVRSKYGSLDKLNQAWGTVFWSQTYTAFDQIPVPLPSGGDPNPGLALDYDRYQSYANASFIEEQLVVLRKLCPKHFVTTNNVSLLDVIDLREHYAKLDFASLDNYPGFFDMLMRESKVEMPTEAITTMIAMSHDFARCIKRKPFLIMEEQSGKAGQKTFAAQPEPGKVRLWTYQAVAHGGMGVNYFRWDTATFGAEEYWHGMLNHDRSKSPAFDEMEQTVKELKGLGRELLYSEYPAETALVFDYDSSWAIAIQPQHFALTYMGQVTTWYGSLSGSHTGIDFVAPGEDWSPYKIVYAPLAHVITAAQAAKIRSYVENGGVYVAGFRSGVKTESSQMVKTPLPGLLAEVMGVTVEDYVPIYGNKQSVKFAGPLAGWAGECGIWADVLRPNGAEVLGTYTAGSYAGKPAITSNNFGKGKAVYLGANLTGEGLTIALGKLSAMAGVKPALQAPRGVEVTVRRAGGKQWMFLLNHTAEARSVDLPGQFTDVVSTAAVSGKLELKGYDARVLLVS
jgi:beta-galactosidase